MSALSPAWADSFDRLTGALPVAEQLQRRVQFESFVATGFPDRSDEAWHYTDLAAQAEVVYRLAFFDEDEDELLAEALPGTERLVYKNGGLDGRHSTVKALDGVVSTRITGEDGIDALNAAFSTRGLVYALPGDTVAERPLHVLLQSDTGDSPAMSHQRHRIALGPNAEATVLLHFVGRGGPRLITHSINVSLAPGAKLNLHRLSQEGEGATLVTRLDATLARDARLHLSGISLGAGLARHRADIVIDGAGAEAHATSLQVPGAKAHVDDLVSVVHAAPHGISRIVARGIIDERAKAIFNGRVVVRPGAQKTDSEQRLANLLLSRKAEVNAKPDLEIYADDVKCAHGATIGQLDEVALSYLRSRGIDKDTARAMLLRAFALQILDRIEWPELRARIEAALHLPAELNLDIDA